MKSPQPVIVLGSSHSNQSQLSVSDKSPSPRPVSSSTTAVGENSQAVTTSGAQMSHSNDSSHSPELSPEGNGASATAPFSVFTPNPTSMPSDLHIRTDLFPQESRGIGIPPANERAPLRRSTSSSSFLGRVSSLHANLQAEPESLSPASLLSSPQLAALTDITPLPSPIPSEILPWNIAAGGLGSRPLSRQNSTCSHKSSSWSLRSNHNSNLSRSNSHNRIHNRSHVCPEASPSIKGFPLPPSSRKPARQEGSSDDSRRSVSAPLHAQQPPVQGAAPSPVTSSRRINTISDLPEETPIHSPLTPDSSFRREKYLAIQRGMRPVSPPSSPRDDTGDHSPATTPSEDQDNTMQHGPVFVVRSPRSDRLQKFRGLRQIGVGAFSRVILAERDNGFITSSSTSQPPTPLTQKCSFVAMKISEFGPPGCPDEGRAENSFSREVDLLKDIHHSSIVQLRGYGASEDGKHGFLAMNYCPGHDLFEVASHASTSQLLSPPVIRRIFAELVDATLYLHRSWIVHRDLKLENLLLNLTPEEIKSVEDWSVYPYPLITLTDLGLSRRIPKPPESPLLETRCGSIDYAAPEIVMGQPYDGRATDAWAFGVILYALLENRLPFDPLPNARGDRETLCARTPHRIARCEYAWAKYGDDDGDWDDAKGSAVKGAHDIVAGLLLRSTRRLSVQDVAAKEWVSEAIKVNGGIKRPDDAL